MNCYFPNMAFWKLCSWAYIYFLANVLFLGTSKALGAQKITLGYTQRILSSTTTLKFIFLDANHPPNLFPGRMK